MAGIEGRCSRARSRGLARVATVCLLAVALWLIGSLSQQAVADDEPVAEQSEGDQVSTEETPVPEETPTEETSTEETSTEETSTEESSSGEGEGEGSGDELPAAVNVVEEIPPPVVICVATVFTPTAVASGVDPGAVTYDLDVDVETIEPLPLPVLDDVPPFEQGSPCQQLVCEFELPGDCGGTCDDFVLDGPCCEVDLHDGACCGGIEDRIGDDYCVLPLAAATAPAIEGPGGIVVTFTEFFAPQDSLATITQTIADGAPIGLIETPFCATETSTVEGSAVTFTVEADFEFITGCLFVVDSHRVCVSKFMVGHQGSGFKAKDFSFSATERPEGTPLGDIDMKRAVPEACPRLDTPDGSRFGEFFVAPGTRFTVTETAPADDDVTDAKVSSGPVYSTCGNEPKPSASANGRANGEDATTCIFENASVPVCVVKVVEDGGQSAGYSANEFGFELRTRDGELLGALSPDDLSRNAGNGCPQEEPPSNSVRYGTFWVAPGTKFTVAEILPADAAPYIGPAYSECAAIEERERAVVALDEVVEETAEEAAEEAADQQNANRYLTANGKAPDSAYAAVECAFFNDSVPVCVAKLVEYRAFQDGLKAKDMTFALADRSTGAILGTLAAGDGLSREPSHPACQNEGAPHFYVSNQGQARYGVFWVAPGLRFSVTESIPEGYEHVGPVYSDCSDRYDDEWIDDTSDGDEGRSNPSVTENARARIGGKQGPIDCQFVNDTVVVCLTKYVGPNGVDAGYRASDFQFELTADEVTVASERNGVKRSPAEDCANYCDGDFDKGCGVICAQDFEGSCGDFDCPGSDYGIPCAPVNENRAYGYVEYLVAPGTRFQVVEDLVSPSAYDPIGPIGAECYQDYFDGPLKRLDEGADIEGGDSEGADDESPVRAARARARAPRDGGRVICTFVNDSVRVCVSKVVGPEAFFELGARAKDWSFQIAPAGNETDVFSFNVETGGEGVNRLRARPSQWCEPEDEPFGAIRWAEVYVAPKTKFDISETGPAASAVGLEYAECSATGYFFMEDDYYNDYIDFEGDELRKPVPEAPPETIRVNTSQMLDGPKSGTIRCEFVNDTVAVCAHKHVFETALQAGYSAQDFSFLIESESPVEYPGFEANDDGSVAVSIDELDTYELCRGEIRCDDFCPDEIERQVDVGPTETGAYHGVVRFYVQPWSEYSVTEVIPAGAAVGPVYPPSCSRGDGPQGSPKLLSEGNEEYSLLTASGVAVPFARSQSCNFANDSVAVCVTKVVRDTAAGLGYVPADFPMTISWGGNVASEPQTPVSGPCFGPADVVSEIPEVSVEPGSVQFFVPPFVSFVVTETIPEGAPVGMVGLGNPYSGSACMDFDAPKLDLVDVSQGDDEAAVLPPNSVGGFAYGGYLQCVIHNDSIQVRIDKTVVNDEGGEAVSGSFLFEVFDADGASLGSGYDTNAETGDGSQLVVHVAPGQTVRVSEQVVTGYELASAVCPVALLDDGSEFVIGTANVEAAVANPVIVEIPADSASVECAFENHDLPRVPICVTQVLDPGLTNFELGDLEIELYSDGSLVSTVAGDAAGGNVLCGGASDEVFPVSFNVDSANATASGNPTLLGEVVADGSSFTVAQKLPDDSGIRLLTNSVDCSPASSGVASASFVPVSGTPISCTLTVTAVPVPVSINEVVQNGPAEPGDFTLTLTNVDTGDVVMVGNGPTVNLADIAPGAYSASASSVDFYELVVSGCNGTSGDTFIIDNETVAIDCTFEHRANLVPRRSASSPVEDPEEAAVEEAAPAAPPLAVTPISTEVIGSSALAVTGSSSNSVAMIGMSLVGGGALLAGIARRRRRD